MFSLIITIVALLLVAALALLAYYFTTDTAAKYQAKAAATTLITQGQQIAAAGSLSTAEGKGWPALAPHFKPPYLNSMPNPPRNSYTPEAGIPQPTDWAYFMLGPPEDRTTQHFVIPDRIRKDVCMEVNRLNGFIGIPATWDGTSVIQCYGTADNPNKGYTFLYDPPGTSAKDKEDVLAETVTQAGPGASVGYPRLCPDGTTIADKSGGVCEGGSPVVDAPGEDAPGDDKDDEALPTSGYWVMEASVPANWNDPYIMSRGFSATCPAGAVNPASSAVQRLATNPAEAYNVDGTMDMRWFQQGGRWDPLGDNDLVRVWCLPANPEDVPASWAAPYANWSGAVKDVHLHPDRPGVDPMSYDYVGSARATVQAGGVTWSMVAVLFEAGVSDPSNTAYSPYIDGRKVAIGRGPQPEETFYDNVASNPWYTEVQNSPYGRESGTVVFEPPQAPPSPELWSLSPRSGPVAGGTTVTLWGANFRDDDIVYFDGNKPATVISRTPDKLVVSSPPAASGRMVYVTLYNPTLGVSAYNALDFEYKEDPLVSSVCYNMGKMGPNMLFSRNGATLLETGSDTLIVQANNQGEVPIRVRTSTPMGRAQEGFDKYIAIIKGARIDGNKVPARTTLVSAAQDGTLTFEAWVPASGLPTNHVPMIELETCGDYVPVSSFTGYRPQVISTAPDECLGNTSRTPGQCTRSTVDYQTGDIIATPDWWLRGVYWTGSVYGTTRLNTSVVPSAGGTCTPRAWQSWWWDSSAKTSGSGTGWVECNALYSETKSYAQGYFSGTGSYSGVYLRSAGDIQDFYARGGTSVPYLNGRQNWGYGGESIYNFPFHTQDWPGKANCTWSGCNSGSFMRFGTVTEFNAYMNAVQSGTPTQGGTSTQALSSYACVHEQYFTPATPIQDSSGTDVSSQVTQKVRSSACFRMLNNNEVPPLN